MRQPLFQPEIEAAEIGNALDALTRGEIGPGGPFRDAFEAQFAREVSARHVLTTSSGTTALHLGLTLLGLEPGDEVILPSLTYVATANAVRHAGAVPVFADVSPDTWCLDPEDVEQRITPRTRGILLVHLYGGLAPLGAFRRLAERHGLWLMADGAHAALTRFDGIGSGGLMTLTAYSFHLNKTLTCGEGGALAVNDTAMFERARVLRSHGMDYFRRGVFHEVGFNYRLSNLACGILCAQLARVPSIRRRRSAIRAAYDAAFAEAAGPAGAGVQLQPVGPAVEPELWLYSLLVPDPARMAAVLAAAGIDTRRFFQPVHRLPFWSDAGARAAAPLPVTEALAARGISLPTYNTLSPAGAARIAEIAVGALQAPSAAAT